MFKQIVLFFFLFSYRRVPSCPFNNLGLTFFDSVHAPLAFKLPDSASTIGENEGDVLRLIISPDSGDEEWVSSPNVLELPL